MAQDRFALLEHPCRLSQSAWPKIQRVAHHLRNRKAFARYYCPRIVSLGPIHHGEPHLELGEQYKLSWASMYVQGDRNKAQRLHGKIVVNIKDVKHLYTDDAVQHFSDDELAWMLFVDGCALLQIQKYPDIMNAEPLEAKADQLLLVRQDALLLENQLPFRVLQLLSDLSDADLIVAMDDFLFLHHFSSAKTHHQHRIEGEHCVVDAVPRSSNPLPVHLLDELRRGALRDIRPCNTQKPIKEDRTRRNLKELKKAGIQVKRNNNSRCPPNVTFSSSSFGGELILPDIVVDDTFAPLYLNLMAYEACPDFENKYEISSYVEFLSYLIDHADDVKELRKAGVLVNCLGSDEEVARLFNVITTDLVPDISMYASVRSEIESYFEVKYKIWLAQAYHAYFSNSGSFIAFVAACAILLLTFLQTWFTISGSK
ncbi:UPF0481 protein At3g47200-like [Prosopis cineraria]|uniref:UPF0481 protein At3g47200-like n=1 Tax=Prosopis cineraria TaxID=364024 RepID=UPI00240F08FC|nr:UPF0481 protein At3g47200-like [Prosopis cineraria]